jgi:glycerol-3-phosphate acyltransferase PlsX
VVEGAVAACREFDLQVVLVGPQGVVAEELRRAQAGDAPHPGRRRRGSGGDGGEGHRATLKKRSSITWPWSRCAMTAADAFFSAGNTAACWTIAKLVLGTLEEVDRPALAAALPHPTGRTVLIDVGANANCNARNLEEFAVMGKVYTSAVFHTPNRASAS